MAGTQVIVAPASAQTQKRGHNKNSTEISTAKAPPTPKQQDQHRQVQQDEKKVEQQRRDGDDSRLEAATTRYNPGYSSFVDESDMVVLRLLELVHSMLVFGMKLLKSHGRYAYSAS
ncbi:hypothetical protein V5799_013858 [Amblyomma americanum]|uniref:Uncharacterized protein n=1 Tax=Amblyomma americanum TaxID=6943 RepID=A0AAQ4E4S1_AMBAM